MIDVANGTAPFLAAGNEQAPEPLASQEEHEITMDSHPLDAFYEIMKTKVTMV